MTGLNDYDFGDIVWFDQGTQGRVIRYDAEKKLLCVMGIATHLVYFVEEYRLDR